MRAALEELEELDGFLAAAIGDARDGSALAFEQANAPFDVVTAVAVNAEVVTAKMHAIEKLALKTGVEDILITLGDQYPTSSVRCGTIRRSSSTSRSTAPNRTSRSRGCRSFRVDAQMSVR